MFEVTEKASEMIKDFLKDRDVIPAIRVMLSQGGWSGPSLGLALDESRDGDEIFVFNDRGKVAIKAMVTERIIPGVVSIFEGAWYNPDKNGIDRGACANTLTKDAYSGGGATVMNTCLVEIEKAWLY